jgi:DNA-binding MarR family transcriptional regulator
MHCSDTFGEHIYGTTQGGQMQTRESETASETPPRRPLQDFLTFRIANLANALNTQAGEILRRDCGISLNDWRVLSLATVPGLRTTRDMVAPSGIDSAIISRALQRLEDGGLILTVRGAKDRREREIHLTVKGRALHTDMAPTMQKRQEALIALLDEGEQRMVFTILDKLNEGAKRREF